MYNLKKNLWLAWCFLLFLFFGTISSISLKLKIDSSSSLKSLQEQNDTVNILLTMSQDEKNISKLLKDDPNWPKEENNFETRTQRIQSLYKILQNEANKVQKDLLDFLTAENSLRKSTKKFQIRQLWISNQIIVKGADWLLIEQLVERRDISEIEEETFIPLLLPRKGQGHGRGRGQVQPKEDLGHSQSYLDALLAVDGVGIFKSSPPWSISAIGAPEVWQNGTRGQGIVVASIDTGARLSHEALKNNYKKDHGWFDPQHHSNAPYDGNGHGTHILGTILGRTREIGVAPDSEWIACRGCGMDSCSSYDLLECGQWVMCPTDYEGENADCSKAPHVVSNSWGGGSIKYDKIIEAWRAAGIIPVFSIGNDGPTCSSTLYPGNHPEVIGVGSTRQGNYVSDFSSLGPITGTAGSTIMKPDIAAPGSNILSAWTTTDTAYETQSGTSMACPMVSGLVALMLSRDPDLSYEQIKSLLQAGAHQTHSTGKNCGNVTETSLPNYHVGYGQIDAYNSVVRKGPGSQIDSAGASILGSQGCGKFFIIFYTIFVITMRWLRSNLFL